MNNIGRKADRRVYDENGRSDYCQYLFHGKSFYGVKPACLARPPRSAWQEGERCEALRAGVQ